MNKTTNIQNNQNINYDNYILNSKENQNYYIISLLSLFCVGYLFYHSCFFSILIGFLSIPLKKTYAEYKSTLRRNRLRIQFRDLLYSLSSSVSSGHQMSEAFEDALHNLSLMYEPDEPIIKELQQITRTIRESRATEEVLLKDFAFRSGIEEIINFSDVYSTCRSTGADISQMIGKASQILMDKMTIEREIYTIISQKKVEAKIISSMPLIMLIFLNITSPEYLESMYYTLSGRIIMTAALGVVFISYKIMNKIMEISI